MGRQGILLDLLSVLVQLREPQDIWTEAVHKIKWLLEFDRVDLALLDKSGRSYSLKSLFESRPGVPAFAKADLSREKGFLAQLGNDPAVLHTGRLREDLVVDPDLEAGSLAQLLIVRLRADEKDLGALCFGSEREDAYGHPELELAATLAAHLSMVFDRVQGYREVLRDLEGFSYSVAHDLRAPIRSIHQHAEQLIEEQTLTGDGRRSLHRILASAEEMDSLINGLIDYSRLARSSVPMGPISLQSSVTRVLEDLERKVSKLDARITLEGEFGNVFGNEILLHQVLTNLIDNALKFVLPSQSPRVTLRAERRDHHLRVWVEDRGIGLSGQEAERLFRVFERIHPVATYPGAGIGLAVVRRAVERMGGTVGVESEPGQGSRFWFELGAA